VVPVFRTITVGPFAAFFTNINREMKIPGHSHFCEVTITYETMGPVGFPAFAGTYTDIQESLIVLFDRPLHDYTNERVAELLWDYFSGYQSKIAESRWQARIGEHYKLRGIELAVRGVPDKIGHADGFTRYRIYT
jgi:hypothetical protein